MYTKEEEIIHFLFIAFKDMNRIKENIPMASHSIMVGNILKNENLDEDTIYIGYLHDIIEDTKYDYEYLKEHYGSKIADGVLKVTEDQSIENFLERKEKFVNNISKCDDSIMYIEIADKLHNLLSDYDSFMEKGLNGIYSEDRIENTIWYYKKLQEVFNNHFKNRECNLLKRFNEIIALYFN